MGENANPWLVAAVVAATLFSILVGMTELLLRGIVDLELIATLLWLFAAAAIYLAPAVTASLRRHPSRDAIWALNLLLGWTLVGWLVALAWSSGSGRTAAAPVVLAPAQFRREPRARQQEPRYLPDGRVAPPLTARKLRALPQKLV